MKKLLLCLSLLGAVFGMQAKESLVYGIAGDCNIGIGNNAQAFYYSGATLVDENAAELLKGQSLTAIEVGFNSGLNKELKVFLTYDLNGEPFYTEDFRIRPGGYNELELDKPYIIEGKPFYMGYEYQCTRADLLPVYFDGNTQSAKPSTSQLAIYDPTGTLYPKQYYDFADKYGNICIRGKVTGDNLPKGYAAPLLINVPGAAAPGEDFNAQMKIRNMGASAISTLELSYKGGSQEVKPVEVTLENPIEIGGEQLVNFKLSYPESYSACPITLSIAKVNGEVNNAAAMTLSSSIDITSYKFTRTLVIEEFTGIACPSCPVGIVGLDELAKNHPDAIIVTAHNYSASDPMYCPSYSSWSARYINAAPQCTVNRSNAMEYNHYYPTALNLEAAYQDITSQVVSAGVTMSAEYTDESKTSVVAKVNTTFGEDTNGSKYGIAIVLMENNVGPYKQANGFASGNPMGGWENKPAYVDVIFDDVARAIYDWEGKAGSVPSEVKQGETYPYELEVPLEAVTNHKEARLVAMLINRNTREIINAARCEITDAVENGSSVEEVTAETSVKGGNGEISVAGEFDAVEIYTLSGCHFGTMTESGSIQAAPGFYVATVSANGAKKSVKILVK